MYIIPRFVILGCLMLGVCQEFDQHFVAVDGKWLGGIEDLTNTSSHFDNY